MRLNESPCYKTMILTAIAILSHAVCNLPSLLLLTSCAQNDVVRLKSG